MLFLLTVEGFSLLIHKDKWFGLIKGLKFSSTLSITHILFVDDVVMFGYGSSAEWRHFRFIIDLFAAASGMSISSEKSSFLTNNISYDTVEQEGIIPLEDGGY